MTTKIETEAAAILEWIGKRKKQLCKVDDDAKEQIKAFLREGWKDE